MIKFFYFIFVFFGKEKINVLLINLGGMGTRCLNMYVMVIIFLIKSDIN